MRNEMHIRITSWESVGIRMLVRVGNDIISTVVVEVLLLCTWCFYSLFLCWNFNQQSKSLWQIGFILCTSPSLGVWTCWVAHVSMWQSSFLVFTHSLLTSLSFIKTQVPDIFPTILKFMYRSWSIFSIPKISCTVVGVFFLSQKFWAINVHIKKFSHFIPERE